jgi:hypothetical protein
MIGHANELYTDESQKPNRHARIEYDHRALNQGVFDPGLDQRPVPLIHVSIRIIRGSVVVNSAPPSFSRS